MDEMRLIAFKNLLGRKNYYYSTEGLAKDEIVFRKRLAFSRHQNQKLQIKIIQALMVVDRIGSGMYTLIDIVTGNKLFLPIDQLIRTRLTRDQAEKLIKKVTE